MSDKMRLKNELEQLLKLMHVEVRASSFQDMGEEFIRFDFEVIASSFQDMGEEIIRFDFIEDFIEKVPATGTPVSLSIYVFDDKVQILHVGAGQLEGNTRCLEVLNKENADITYGRHFILNGQHAFSYGMLINDLKADTVLRQLELACFTVFRATEAIMKARYAFS